MKRQLSLLAVALLLAQPVLAKDIPLNRAAALANSVTPAASSQAYDDLEQQALAQLRHALQGDAATLTRDRLAHTKQNQTQADTAWLKASGYDFQTRANQQAGIALLLAAMIPERYDALVARGARYGFSRIVLGVHYPLDVIGSRMVAERNVAHYLNDPHYRVLFNEARDQLRAALAKACGTSLAECAKSSVKDDPWRDPAMRDFSRFTMTYDLPQQKGPQPRLQVPEGAEVLLEDALPHLSAAQRRALMVNTALPAGYPLSGATPEQQFWQRLNLSAAWEMAQKGINVVSGTLHCVSRFSGNGRTYRSNTQADAPPVIEIPPTIPHSRSHA